MQLSPELDLLVACTRAVSLDEAEVAVIRQALETRPPDWRKMGSVALRHKMAGMLNRSLQALGPDVDAGALATFSALSRRSAVYTLNRLEHLKQIVSVFEGAGIPVVPYKGIALGRQIYDNHAMRPPGDIDIVVRPRDARKAKQILFDLGFRLRHPIDEDEQEFRLEERYCEEFVMDPNIQVELHWAFTNKAIRFAIDIDELFERLESIDLTGTTVRAFAPEDLLLILSVHGAKHHWEHLEYIFAISEIVRKFDLDWPTVLRRANQTGARRKLFLALRVAHDLLGTQLPDFVYERVYADKRVARIAALIPNYLENPPESDEKAGSSDSDLFHFSLQDNTRDRVRFLYHRVTTPSDPDEWNVWRAGPVMIPVHSFIRPFRLLGKLGPALWARLRPDAGTEDVVSHEAENAVSGRVNADRTAA